MSARIGIVMDHISGINPEKDTSLALMLAAQEAGSILYHIVAQDMAVEGGKAFAIAQKITVSDDSNNWFTLGHAEKIALGELDIILMRKDPPVDKAFIHACYILEQAEKDGAYVSNAPAALIALNEKIYATHFPDLCPPTLISANRDMLRTFFDTHEKIIVKPLDSMGGDGVFMLDKNDVNFDVVWETQTQRGTYPVITQAFLPAIEQGDSRIIIIGGEPFSHVLVRTPKPGSIRGNMAAGGHYAVRPITETEHAIAERVGQDLVKRNIAFAGIDVIGGKLIEINITSPTGLRQISKACGQNVAKLVMDIILKEQQRKRMG